MKNSMTVVDSLLVDDEGHVYGQWCHEPWSKRWRGTQGAVVATGLSRWQRLCYDDMEEDLDDRSVVGNVL